MKILAHSKDTRDNELITYQFELPTYLLPELLKFKNMGITWKNNYNNVIDTEYALNSATYSIALNKELLRRGNKIRNFSKSK